jgi:hypothetical protein
MQQWLDLILTADGLVNLAAAFTTLSSAILNRHNTLREQPTDKTKR